MRNSGSCSKDLAQIVKSLQNWDSPKRTAGSDSSSTGSSYKPVRSLTGSYFHFCEAIYLLVVYCICMLIFKGKKKWHSFLNLSSFVLAWPMTVVFLLYYIVPNIISKDHLSSFRLSCSAPMLAQLFFKGCSTRSPDLHVWAVNATAVRINCINTWWPQHQF